MKYTPNIYTPARDIVPLNNNTIDLGSSTKSFAELYVTTEKVDHIGEKTSAHSVVMDNDITISAGKKIIFATS